MPEMSFKPNLDQEVFDRVNRYKKRTGVTKVHFISEAIEAYLDIVEGRAQLVYADRDQGQRRDERTA